MMMSEFRRYLSRVADCANHEIVFTSGASESNALVCCGIINRALCQSSMSGSGMSARTIHIVSSAIEHKSIMYLLRDMVARDPAHIEVSYVLPDASGHIVPAEFARAIRPNTVLATCMLANNEAGAINDVAGISRAIKRVNPRVFFHSDIVQGFGKIPIHLTQLGIDGASVSFHKLHAPVGAGVAMISRANVQGLCPIMFGTQNSGMRGGTENAPAIAAAFAATRMAFDTMERDIAHSLSLKEYLMAQLRKRAPCVTLDEYAEHERSGRPKLAMQLVFVGDTTVGDPRRYLPNTLMIAVAKHIGPPACNAKIKEKLEEAQIIVSVGSACNTSSKEHSHVLRAMNMPSLLMDGAIRVSTSRYTTVQEIDLFVNGFLAEAKRQLDTAYVGAKH
jgi:cysteine desulfurase